MLRVCVTGGRDYGDTAAVEAAMGALLREREIGLLGVGDAGGLDALVRRWAKANGVPYAVFPALWHAHGRSAGPRRNRLMLETVRPDVLVAFPGGRGTASCVAEAQRLGIAVTEANS